LETQLSELFSLPSSNNHRGQALGLSQDGRTIPLIWAVGYTKLQKRVRPQLLAEAEFLNHSLIAIGIVGFEIVEQATPLADQHEKTAARAMVFLVRLEVFRQGANAFAQQSDLNFRAAGIGSVGAVLVDEGFFLLSG
jgi:hypothetical protein